MSITAAQALALCRMGFGLYFLAQAWDKTAKGWLTSGAPMASGLFGNPAAQPPTRGFAANAEPFYRQFLESTVQPNALLFSQLVTIAEWAAGLLLLLGLLTRIGSLVSIWLVLNYMLMKGLPSLGGSSDRLFGLASLAFLLGSAGLVWGLDGAWRHWLAHNPLTRWTAGIPAHEEEIVAPRRVPAREAARTS
jgi:uncharacterized membrane protein YphA (DoxX/SURF4 family)